MNEHLGFTAPCVEFEPRLASELARCKVGSSTATEAVDPLVERSGPFNGYSRVLTVEGGIRVHYKDQDRSIFLACLRVLTWVSAIGVGGWLIFFLSSLSVFHCICAFVALMLICGFVTLSKVEVWHSVEIRSDAMIIDGEDVFYAVDVGDNWPEVRLKDEDPDRMVLSGFCGTRLIEYATVNRRGKSDCTPEILAADLKAAMEQLWGRREVTFTAAV